MSNHSGSHMLNSVLAALERESFFSNIGPERTSEFVADILGLARMYDGNPGEVLGSVSETLGICQWCLQPSEDLEEGACPSCR